MRNALSGLILLAAFACMVEGQDSHSVHRTKRTSAESNALMATYCFDCHNQESKEGGLDLVELLEQDRFDGGLAFENLITGRMPPGNAEQPTASERRVMLAGLTQRQTTLAAKSYRRISRHEFVHSVNDLLGIEWNIADSLPEDRGTRDFDSDRRIMLTREMLNAYFAATDEMLDFALPANGFDKEQIWTTNQIKDSHETYKIYVSKHKEGLLFSWTRANNGNNYSFFYDNFEPPKKGWYELTLDAAKVETLSGMSRFKSTLGNTTSPMIGLNPSASWM